MKIFKREEMAFFPNVELNTLYSLRGEATISYNEFERINSLIKNVEDKYKNPNELIIGSVTPNGLSLENVKNEVDITVVGNGFKDGIHISVGSLCYLCL